MTDTPSAEEVAGKVAALTLWQPWASLIFATDADGSHLKQHETRGFRLPARLMNRPIAIHAAKAFPAWRHISPALHDLCLEAFGCQYHETLPRGCVLGTVVPFACGSTDDMFTQPVHDDDWTAGDWSPHRYAWRLTDVRALAAPIVATGRQGWWSIETERLAA